MFKKLIFTPLRFYSQDDEALFFGWMDKIACIKSYKGTGKELHLSMDSRIITFNEFVNLVGLFKRYKLKKPEQLLQLLDNEKNKTCFSILKKIWPRMVIDLEKSMETPKIL